MKKLDLNDVSHYVEKNIGTFHQKRIQSLDDLKLAKVLKRKNPYLFKAKHVLTAEQIIKGLVDAHVSANEETIFGDCWKDLLFLSMIKFTQEENPGFQALISNLTMMA